MPTFAPAAVVPQLVAQEALTQLFKYCVFPKTAVGGYEPNAFERGDSVTVRRPRLSQAQDYDPRSGVPAVLVEPGYSSATLTLEKLWTDGFPVYSQDNRDSVGRYVKEYGMSIAQAINTSNDSYFYNKFRTVSIPTSGVVAYSYQPPVGIVATQSNGQFTNFGKQALVNAEVYLNAQNVPAGDRFAILSSAAGGGFLGDTTLVEGFVATQAGGAGVFMSGLAPGSFLQRYGFQVSTSNSVGMQVAQSQLDSSSANSASVAISAAAIDSNFTNPEYQTATLLGAVALTLTTTGSLANVAIGQIAAIGPTGANNSQAFGLVLRVAGNVISLVPFTPAGILMPASQIAANTSTWQFSIPFIPSVSVAFHKEALLYANRPLAQPTDGSGATMATATDEMTNLGLQIVKGGYQVNQFFESQRYAMLIGALLSDQRKAVLMLSA